MTSKQHVRLLLPVLVICFWSLAEGARILAVWPMEAPSHYILGERLLKELAGKGHDVTMISPFSQKTPVKNYRDITVDGIREKLFEMLPQNETKVNLVDIGQMFPFNQALLTGFIGHKVTELVLEHQKVQKLLSDPKEKFDLIIFEMFHTESLYGLAHKYDAPVIILSTIGSSVWTNHLVGNIAPSSFVPDLFLNFKAQMSFPERVFNTFHNYAIEIYRKLMYFPEVEKTMKKFFPNTPGIYDLMYNRTALILVNSHFSISDPKPHVPAMIEIGGFHVKDPQPLPKELKEFMDKASHGVILFSMGSNLKSVDLDDNRRNHILKTFAKLKQKIIWKWEDEQLPGKPDNVKIMKWCPQNDILAHPNLKLFITHGGLLSTTESVYHGVPVVGIPMFGDQKLNVEMTKRKGFGVGVSYLDLTEELLSNAVNEVLNNPKYKQNALLALEVLRNQPVKPIDAAIFWVNHVLKYKGAPHLRAASLDLTWWQLYSLDIIAFVVLIDIILFAIFYYLCKKICRRSNPVKKNSKDSKKKKN